MEVEKLKEWHHHGSILLKDLRGKVSKYALDKIQEQVDIVNMGNKCSALFTRTYGLPCCHTLFQYFNKGKIVSLEDVHTQWHLNYNPIAIGPAQQECLQNQLTPTEKALADIRAHMDLLSSDELPVYLEKLEKLIKIPVPLLSNPEVVVKTKGRPAGSKNESNRRVKSAFEYVEGRKCRRCGDSGHNSRTCKK